MQDLRLVGVSEDGANLLLADGDGGRYSLAISDELRTTIRRDRREPASADGQAKQENPLRPRDVQGLIRAGVPLEEIAERAGWSLEKVQRYEGPIRAERDYVSELAQRVQLSGRGETMTLRERADRRLAERGVEAERVIWDSWKSDDTHWTVVVRFPAGGRQREATWLFDPVNRALRTVDDEARWLGGDEIPAADEAPADASPAASSGRARAHRDVAVFDVEAEGGVADPQSAHLGARMGAPDPRAGGGDLTSAMRARQASRGRARTGSATKGTGRTSTGQAAALPGRLTPTPPVERVDVGTTAPPLPSHPRPEELADASQGAASDADEAQSPTALAAVPASTGERAKGSPHQADLDGDAPTDEIGSSADEPNTSGNRRRKTRRPRARIEPVSVRTAIRPDEEVEQDESLFGELPGFHDGGDESGHDPAADPETTAADAHDDHVEVDAGATDHEGVDAVDADDDADGRQDAKPSPKATRAGASQAQKATTDSNEKDAAAPTQDVPSRASQSRKSNRPSVPSWDDIMFGGRGPRK